MAQTRFEKILGDVLPWICCPCLSPCLCVLGVVWCFFPNQKEKRVQKLKKKRTKAWHARLPSRTIVQNPERSLRRPNMAGKLNPKSALFDKLPPEIRHQIYGYILGSMNIELRIVNSECAVIGGHCPGVPQGVGSYPHHLECYDHAENERSAPFELRVKKGTSLLSLMMACKSAHFDVKSYMFACTTFQMVSLTAFMSLERLMIPDDFQSIRNLHLRWQHRHHPRRCFTLEDVERPFDLETWRQACKMLQTMHELKRLRVDMVVNAHCSINSSSEVALLTELLPLASKAQTEVFLSWHWSYQKNEPAQAWPFRVTRSATRYIQPVWSDVRECGRPMWGGNG